MISNALMYPCVPTVNQCGCIYPGISMITAYVYQFCQPTYIQDIYRCLCQTYVGVHPPPYSQGEYSCIYLFHQNTYIQGFYHWSNGVVGTAYTRITEWSICIYLYPGFVQSVVLYSNFFIAAEGYPYIVWGVSTLYILRCLCITVSVILCRDWNRQVW